MSKAVIIKGPRPESRSYITVLPDSMQALIEKAKDLFPVPPNHTAHFTLADDNSVIVLPDFLPLIKEREILIFRWTPDTPRSSLRRSMGSTVESVRPHHQQQHYHPDQANVLESAARSNSRPLESSSDFNRSSRGVRWDESVVSNEEKNRRILARSRGQKENRDSASSRHRAEYVKLKIQEQEELRQREEEANCTTKKGGASQQQPREDNGTLPNDPFTDPEPLESHHAGGPSQLSNSDLTQEDLLASGSSPPSYSSPKQQQQHQLRKESGQSDEEQQNSSPLASPTRDIRGAKRNDNGKVWMMELCAEKQPLEKKLQMQEEESKGQDVLPADEEESEEAVTVPASEDDSMEAEPCTVSKGSQQTATTTEENTEEEDKEKSETAVESEEVTANNEVSEMHDNEEEEEEAAVEQITSPQRQPEVNVRDVPAYQTMKSVVSQLRSHPSNQCFRQPCSDEFTQFCKERNRPVVDLFTISNAITLGKYGLDDPLKQFHHDLEQMWNNIRTFYAPQSQQTQCVGVLETFSGILLEEWKRSTNAASRPIKPRPAAGSRTSYSTPMSRVEKHHQQPGQDITPKTQQQAYFASLIAKTGLAPTSSPSRMLARLGQTLKRPAASAPKSQRPAKKIVANDPEAAAATVKSLAPTSSSEKEAIAPDMSTGIVTRRLAKRNVA